MSSLLFFLSKLTISYSETTISLVPLIFRKKFFDSLHNFLRFKMSKTDNSTDLTSKALASPKLDAQHGSAAWTSYLLAIPNHLDRSLRVQFWIFVFGFYSKSQIFNSTYRYGPGLLVI
jgi:hypothetical protein